MLGRFISDLETGDLLSPIEYVMTPFIAREYCHGVEEDQEWFHFPRTPYGRQVAPPTLVHIDKIRLLRKSCPSGAGPHARIHYEYHARHHSPTFVGERLVASGRVSNRYVKRGRTYLDIEIELRAVDGRLITTYSDKTVISYMPQEGSANG